MLRDERSSNVFEDRVLKRMFGPKRYGLTGEWRTPHNEELNDMYTTPKYYLHHQIENGMDGACSTYSVSEWCTQGFGWEI
jgi:hypothetical protein